MVPLSHPPGHAQFDFGEATVVIAGKEMKAALAAFATAFVTVSTPLHAFVPDRERTIEGELWTLPPSTIAPARATRSRRSRLHRGKPHPLSSKGTARDHQRLPNGSRPLRCRRGPTPFAHRRS